MFSIAYTLAFIFFLNAHGTENANWGLKSVCTERRRKKLAMGRVECVEVLGLDDVTRE